MSLLRSFANRIGDSPFATISDINIVCFFLMPEGPVPVFTLPLNAEADFPLNDFVLRYLIRSRVVCIFSIIINSHNSYY